MKTRIKNFPKINVLTTSEFLKTLKNKPSALIILLVIFFTIPISLSAQWERTNGPEGVAVSSFANINGVIYAGTEVNGMYISTDDGISWTARNSGIETFEVTSIIYKPGYIFAGTFGHGVYRTTDEGVTWLQPNNGNNYAVTSLAMEGDYLYAGTISNGVQRSSDNGVTWEEKLNEFGVGALCTNGNKIIGSSSNYSFSSTDHGETWANIPSLEGASIFTLNCTGNVIYAGERNRLYISTDNGISFTSSSVIIPTFSLVNIFSILLTGSDIFVATSYDGIYKSTDGASTWTASNLGMGPKDTRAITMAGSSVLLAGTHYTSLYRSTDLGSSWSKSQQGFPAGSNILSALYYDNSIFAGTREGVYRSDDNGNEWKKLIANNDTVNYGDAWSICEFEDVIYVGFEIYFDAFIFKSSDKGENWIKCTGNGLPPGLSFIKGLVSNGSNLVAGSDEGIFYSTDRGENWNPTNISGLNVTGLATSGNYIYAPVPGGAGIYRSVDNGVSWSVSLQSSVDYVEVAAYNNFVIAGAFFGGARYSQNFGSTWFVSSGFPFDASVFALGAADNGLVIAGTDQSPDWVYASFDNGTSFIPYSEGLGLRASVEAIAISDTFIFAGTDQHGIWKRLRPGISGIQSNQSAPEKYYLSQNFPNPFNPTTNIEFGISSVPGDFGYVSLKVFDVLGKEVSTLLNKKLAPGTYQVKFDGNGLPSGVYFYRLSVTGTKSEYLDMKSMLLVK